ncbi:hypothetical protein [Hoeflea ulvae]|uniref:Uncharacterized protein n=1 Tax=Hoeflea ulvae TaxID=2983764 RepID=A0ABT3YJS0_9HYPH|nr:hypothetical protein [Hoeflea ulvae]MCY0095985.1 hypothetical protein [Hoeflea ulvae]
MTMVPADPPRSSSFKGVFVRALGLVFAAVVTGVLFAAWQANGPSLLNALVANGLAWCL